MYIKKEFKYAFEPLLVEGQCYVLSNFAVAENDGTLPLLPHKWKIVFNRNTVVTRIDPFNEDTHGFQFEPFNSLLDSNNKYESSDYVGMYDYYLYCFSLRFIHWLSISLISILNVGMYNYTIFMLYVINLNNRCCW